VSSKTCGHLRARQEKKYCNWSVPEQKPETVSLACWLWQHLTAGEGHGRAASTLRLRCSKSPFPVSRFATASALACARDCLLVPPYHSGTRQGTMLSHKRRKRLLAYLNFSDAILPHVARIAVQHGAGAVRLLGREVLQSVARAKLVQPKNTGQIRRRPHACMYP